MSEKIVVELENGEVVTWGDLKELSFDEQLDFIGIEAIPSVVKEITELARRIEKMQNKDSELCELNEEVKSIIKNIETEISSTNLVRSCLRGSLKEYVKSEMERLYY